MKPIRTSRLAVAMATLVVLIAAATGCSSPQSTVPNPDELTWTQIFSPVTVGGIKINLGARDLWQTSGANKTHASVRRAGAPGWANIDVVKGCCGKLPPEKVQRQVLENQKPEPEKNFKLVDTIPPAVNHLPLNEMARPTDLLVAWTYQTDFGPAADGLAVLLVRDADSNRVADAAIIIRVLSYKGKTAYPEYQELVYDLVSGIQPAQKSTAK